MNEFSVGRRIYFIDSMKTGYIYFIQMDRIGPIKIGFTTNFENRLVQLQTSCPYPLNVLCVYPTNIEHEKEWHLAFDSIRMEGEWFLPHPKLLTEIQQQIDLNKKHGYGIYEKMR